MSKKVLPISLLMHEGPISRIYLGLFYEYGFKFNKIYFLNYKNENIKKKKIAPYLPDFLTRKIAKQVHAYQLNYWVHYLHKKYPSLYLEITSKFSKEFRINKKVYNHLFQLKKMSEYCLEYQDMFLSKLSELEKLFSKTKDTFLFSGGGILPKSLFKYKDIKLIHIHPGYLPDIKGADGLLWSIKKTKKLGVSAFIMNERLDCGDIIFRQNLNFPKITKKILLLENKTIYRLIFSFIDPLLRAFCLKHLIQKSSFNFENNKLMKQNYKDGCTYRFMSENLRFEIYKKMCR